MGQHYLPRKYLRGFAKGNTIWVHDKAQRRSFPSQPKSVANETNMYGDAAEEFLATKVEDPALEALDAVRTRKVLTTSGRAVLARYVVALWRRVPRARQFVQELIPAQAESTRAEVHAALNLLLSHDASLCEAVARKHLETDEIVDRMTADGGIEIWQKMLTTHQSLRVEQTLLAMNWTFLTSDEVAFVTGDNPVFFFEHEGIGSPNSELTVPLSASVSLWASHGPRKYGHFVAARPFAAREINRRTASKSTRYVFDRDNAPWILQVLQKESHHHHRLR